MEIAQNQEINKIELYRSAYFPPTSDFSLIANKLVFAEYKSEILTEDGRIFVFYVKPKKEISWIYLIQHRINPAFSLGSSVAAFVRKKSKFVRTELIRMPIQAQRKYKKFWIEQSSRNHIRQFIFEKGVKQNVCSHKRNLHS